MKEKEILETTKKKLQKEDKFNCSKFIEENIKIWGPYVGIGITGYLAGKGLEILGITVAEMIARTIGAIKYIFRDSPIKQQKALQQYKKEFEKRKAPAVELQKFDKELSKLRKGIEEGVAITKKYTYNNKEWNIDEDIQALVDPEDPSNYISFEDLPDDVTEEIMEIMYP